MSVQSDHNAEVRIRSGLLPIMREGFRGFLDLIFPPRCVHCGRVDTTFCEADKTKLHDRAVNFLQRPLPEFVDVYATGHHDGILQSAVQALKYYDARELATPLGKRIVSVLMQQQWTFDIIVPVPMHTSRLQERGYNQAEEIAQVVAMMTRKPNLPEAIIRQRPTRSQVGLNQQERQQNLADAFVADQALVAAKRLLLVDDVLTTGTTLSGCAQAAIEGGADEVYGITITQA